MSLNEKAMIVYLNISCWSARKYDRKISKEIETRYNADEAGRYNKVLIAKEHQQNIKKIISNIRTFHYENTLPWNDNGGRLLPSANYFNYVKSVREFQDEYEQEVAKFLLVYPSLKDEARSRLNGMFNEDDYLHVATLREKYAFQNQIAPIPEADDFRVTLSADEVESIRESIEEQLKKSTEVAMQDVWDRLFKVVQHMIERLSDPDKKFKNSLVENVKNLCALLPKLNITNNPSLNAVIKEAEEKLTVYDPEVLRQNQDIRNQTAEDAQKIFNKMSQYVLAA